MKKTNALRILDQQKIEYNIIEYIYDDKNLDVSKIAEDNGLELAHIYKTLVLIGDRTGVLVAVLAGNHSLSLKKLAAISGNKKVEMAPIKDLEKITGYVRGGCYPIGMKKKFPVYFDKTASDMKYFFVNAGTKGLLFSCSPEKLLNTAEGEWADIVD